jgi:hypothetical protein
MTPGTSLRLMPVKSLPFLNCYPEPFLEYWDKQLSFCTILSMIAAQSECGSGSFSQLEKG